MYKKKLNASFPATSAGCTGFGIPNTKLNLLPDFFRRKRKRSQGLNLASSYDYLIELYLIYVIREIDCTIIRKSKLCQKVVGVIKVVAIWTAPYW